MPLSHIIQPIETDLLRVKQVMSEALAQRGTHEALHVARKYLASGGKMLRPALVLHTGLALGAEVDTLIDAAATGELIHLATLMHDDVIDNCSLRRGQSTLNNTSGNKVAVLSGDFCFATALRCAARLGSEGVLELGEAVAQVVEGEMSQATQAYNLDMNIDDYISRITQKTGALFALSTKLAAIAANAPRTIRSLAGQFGLYLGGVFQMRDDYLDYFGDEAKMGKPPGNDLCEGVVTLPLLLTARLRPDAELVHRFCRRELGMGDLVAVANLSRECGAELETLHYIRQFADAAQAALRCFPQSAHTDALSQTVELAVSRSH